MQAHLLFFTPTHGSDKKGKGVNIPIEGIIIGIGYIGAYIPKKPNPGFGYWPPWSLSAQLHSFFGTLFLESCGLF
jgi:hypothetical protein